MVKNPSANAGDTGDVELVPGLGRSSGEGNGCPLQYSPLENSMDRGDWGHKESDMTEQLSTYSSETLTFDNNCESRRVLLDNDVFTLGGHSHLCETE